MFFSTLREARQEPSTLVHLESLGLPWAFCVHAVALHEARLPPARCKVGIKGQDVSQGWDFTGVVRGEQRLSGDKAVLQPYFAGFMGSPPLFRHSHPL